MTLNKRTIKVLVVLGVILIGAALIAQFSQARRTTTYLADLATQKPDKVTEAMAQLQLRPAGSIGPRLVPLLQGQQPEAASRAALLIGLVGYRPGSQALQGCLTAPDAVLRIAALQALGTLRASEAIDAVAARLAAADEKAEVRAAAAWALGMIGTAKADAPLIAALSARPAPAPPAAPAAPAAAAPAGPEPTTPAAKAAAARAKFAEALAAAAAAAAAPKPPGPPPDTTTSVRLAAALALGTLRTPAAVDALAETLQPDKEPSPEVRVAAAYALGDVAAGLNDKLKSTAAANGLVTGLEDKNGDVRTAAAYSLAKVDLPQEMEPTTGQALQRTSEDSHYWARLAAERSRSSLHLAQ